MCVNIDYFIRKETAAISYRYNVEGDFESLVFEGKDMLIVDNSPLNIIEKSLRRYDNSNVRAIIEEINVLGNVNVQPIQISGKLGLHWFPSTSPCRVDCVWFAVHHIDRYHQISEKMLKVYLRNGCEITVDCNYFVFDSLVKKIKEDRNEIVPIME